MTSLLALQLLFAIFVGPHTDTKCFEVLHKGNAVGELVATKTTNGDETIYLNTTFIKTKVVKEMRVKFTVQSTYNCNLLEASTVSITLNEKTYASTTTKRVGYAYRFYKDGKLKSTINGDITYSAARMMFEEPKGILNAYSEENGVFDTIKKVVGGTYEKLNSRGKKNIYRYQNATLNSMALDLGLMEVEMQLSE